MEGRATRTAAQPPRAWTANKITVVALVPNDAQLKADPVSPKHRADNSPSTIQDALYDYMLPLMRFYETWGRDIEVKFHTSSGDDETAQRADLVAITAMKPFAVVILAQPVKGTFKVLESGIAAAKIPVMGYAASAKDTNAQAPYRWNSNDPQAAAVNSAEVIGKQLVGEKAEFGGDGVKNETRKFGAVYVEDGIDYTAFTDYFAKFGGKITNSGSFAASALERTDRGADRSRHHDGQDEGHGRHDDRDVRRLSAVRPVDAERHQPRLLPGVVLHRLRLQRSRPRRPVVPDRTVEARLRPVVHLSLDRGRHAGTARGARTPPRSIRSTGTGAPRSAP